MIINPSVVRKEVRMGVLSKSFYIFFLMFSSIILFAFYSSDFFSDTWYPLGTYMSIGFTLSVFFSAYAGYLSSVLFAWEFENNTIRPLLVYLTRKEVFWSKTLSVLIILAVQYALLIILILIIGSARGMVNLYFIMLFIQILGAIYIFSIGAYALTLLVALTFRRVAYPAIVGVGYGLFVIMGFFLLSSSYSPGVTYLCLNYSYAWSPVHYIPYVIFGTIEWGFVPALLLFAPLIWIIPVVFLAETYFGRCEL
ncbi:MAG: hypothetical protein GXO25_06110 [Euryarchaeota archaeon]|nr:hypothetical protein [Euryarchaeota archaeon]